jgi:hypothetical protein
MVGTTGCDVARLSKSLKTDLSSDWSLQLDSMKPESLVIANQNVAVNTFSGIVHTARHATRVCYTRSQSPNRKEGAAQGRTDDWGEVVTRYPYRKVRMDHLLSMEFISIKYNFVKEFIVLLSFERIFFLLSELFFENWIM